MRISNDLGIRKDFLSKTLKTQTIEQSIDKFCIKIEDLCSTEGTTGKWRDDRRGEDICICEWRVNS